MYVRRRGMHAPCDLDVSSVHHRSHLLVKGKLRARTHKQTYACYNSLMSAGSYPWTSISGHVRTDARWSLRTRIMCGAIVALGILVRFVLCLPTAALVMAWCSVALASSFLALAAYPRLLASAVRWRSSPKMTSDPENPCHQNLQCFLPFIFSEACF